MLAVKKTMNLNLKKEDYQKETRLKIISKGDQVEDADDEDCCSQLQTANSVKPPRHP
jgi:hypothetical protein